VFTAKGLRSNKTYVVGDEVFTDGEGVSLIRIATRKSPLAIWQAEYVAKRLTDTYHNLLVDLVLVDTVGDQTQAAGTPLHEIGGQGVFVKEVQAAVLRGDADIAVHSAKDLQSTDPEGLVLIAVPCRDDFRDGLVGSTLEGLRMGATVATGSVRRRAQLAALRPDVNFVELRGNMHTRVAKADEPGIDAVLVGCAGLDRLGLGDRITERLSTEVMLPQIGQGTIAIECRVGDKEVMSLVYRINNRVALRMLDSERGFLARFGSGCELPIAGLATEPMDGIVLLEGLVAAPDGSVVVRHSVCGTNGMTISLTLYDDLIERGGAALLR
jgi:hydroxymethylbilane synthase